MNKSCGCTWKLIRVNGKLKRALIFCKLHGALESGRLQVVK